MCESSLAVFEAAIR